jgi:hypothetical protein
MTGGGKRDWRAVGCAALLGASIAFPAGLMVGVGGAPSRNAPEAKRSGSMGSGAQNARNPYSARIVDDPYVIEEQRKVLRALETSCRQLKQHCAEAEQARRRIEEAQGRP